MVLLHRIIIVQLFQQLVSLVLLVNVHPLQVRELVRHEALPSSLIYHFARFLLFLDGLKCSRNLAEASVLHVETQVLLEVLLLKGRVGEWTVVEDTGLEGGREVHVRLRHVVLDDLHGHFALHAVPQVLVLHDVRHVVVEMVGDSVLYISDVDLLLQTQGAVEVGGCLAALFTCLARSDVLRRINLCRLLV